jgi:hypothetical protein
MDDDWGGWLEILLKYFINYIIYINVYIYILNLTYKLNENFITVKM